MSTIGRPTGRIGCVEEALPIRNIELHDGPAEKLQRSLGLVVWHLMSSLVDAREGEIAILPYLAILGAVDEEGGVACSVELRCVRVVDLFGDCFATKPIADVVSIAVD